MGRVRPAIPRSRTAWHRRVRMDPAAIRHWFAVAVLAVTLTWVVANAQRRADHAVAGWGRTRPVLVATHPVRAGQPVAGAARIQRWPSVLLPARTVDRLQPGDLATADLTSGSPLTEASVRHRGTRGADGRRTIAVALGPAHLSVDPGDVVDVWATVDRSVAGETPPVTRLLARDAQVVSASDRSAVLVVRRSEVPPLAAVAASGAAILVGSG